MRKLLKIILVCFVCIFSVALLSIAIVLIYGSISSFYPNQTESLKVINSQNRVLQSDTLSIITWNIGYGGLGKEMDFFYEGGKMTRPTEELSRVYLEGVIDEVQYWDKPDIILFQEVDFKSKRSYRINQLEKISVVLPGYAYVSALNYEAGWVPVPLNDPMGKVSGGMATFSKFTPVNAVRIATPGQNPWPDRMFTLKRCFVETRFKTFSGKELVVYNIHNSAFSHESELREQELGLLKELISKAYSKGNYVIVGGDWNQNPPGFDKTNIRKYFSRDNWPVESDFMPSTWNWGFDASLPTNRDVIQAFDLSKVNCTVLDFFLVSPNIEIVSVKTRDLDFENSDHHPVCLQVILN